MQDDVELFANWMEVLQWYKRMYLDEASSAAGKDEAACRAAAAAAETEQVKMEAEEAYLPAYPYRLTTQIEGTFSYDCGMN